MKRKTIYIALLSAISLLIGCTGNEQESKQVEKDKPVPKTTIEFAETSFDFGKISQGENVTHYFRYKNTGDNPLIVSSVQASCGCTIPEWTKEPLEPGKEGRIEVLFNSEGRDGSQHKTITVVSNTTPATNLLTFTAEVVRTNAAQDTTK